MHFYLANLHLRYPVLLKSNYGMSLSHEGGMTNSRRQTIEAKANVSQYEHNQLPKEIIEIKSDIIEIKENEKKMHSML